MMTRDGQHEKSQEKLLNRGSSCKGFDEAKGPFHKTLHKYRSYPNSVNMRCAHNVLEIFGVPYGDQRIYSGPINLHLFM
jgi:hypothetical protein